MCSCVHYYCHIRRVCVRVFLEQKPSRHFEIVTKVFVTNRARARSLFPLLSVSFLSIISISFVSTDTHNRVFSVCLFFAFKVCAFLCAAPFLKLAPLAFK